MHLKKKDTCQSIDFWNYLVLLVTANPVCIDRPQNTFHPSYPDICTPLDYGYLEGTSSADGGGIDVWVGTSGNHLPCGIIVTIDLLKRDKEIKILSGFNEEETHMILDFHNT
jgi:inorganic pyrophosphatase